MLPQSFTNGINLHIFKCIYSLEFLYKVHLVHLFWLYGVCYPTELEFAEKYFTNPPTSKKLSIEVSPPNSFPF